MNNDAFPRALFSDAPPPDGDDFPTWWRALSSLRDAHPHTADQALLCGVRSPCVAFAFGAGYQAALRALVPTLDPHAPAALCVTERGGGHPRAIESRLTRRASGHGWLLSGEKTFVTLGLEARTWIVAASLGERHDGLNDIALVCVDADIDGATLTPHPPLPMIPEISHATLTLEAVALPEDALLGDDGYLRFIKPFRTIEDIHVHAALIGYVVGLCRREGWRESFIEQLLSVAVTLRALALADPLSPSAHLALAGALDLGQRALRDVEPALDAHNSPALEPWRRDLALLSIAKRARERRLESAWRALEKS